MDLSAKDINDSTILTSVISLTGERNKRALIQALMQSLGDFVEYRHLSFLQLSNHLPADHCEIVHVLPDNSMPDYLQISKGPYGENWIKLDEAMSKCAEQKTPISTDSRVVFPVVINHNVVGLLDIDGLQHTIDLENLISGFIHVYSNFLDVLEDAQRDALTGLLNRKTFDQRFGEYLIASAEEQSKTKENNENEHRHPSESKGHWIGMLDIDHFKQVNDTYGHIYGDEVLLLFTDLMRKVFRNNDLLFRFGGEEFVVFIVGSKKQDALKALERFRKEVESFEFPQVGHITVSIGMTSVNTASHPSNLLEEADKALYYAKEHGRNQIHDYADLVEKGLVKARVVQNDIDLF